MINPLLTENHRCEYLTIIPLQHLGNTALDGGLCWWSRGSKINRAETEREERGDQTSHQAPLWSIKLSYFILSVLTFSHGRITTSSSLWSSKCIKRTEPYFREFTCCDVGITDLKQPLDLKWYININITFEPQNGSHNI